MDKDRKDGVEMIVVFDKFINDTDVVQAMIRRIDCDARIVVLGDSPFSASNTLSLYDYFIYGQEQELLEEKKLHFNFIDVPEFWEIRMEAWYRGAIYDMGCKKADIYFDENHCVQRVQWLMENGWVYRVDYYNKYALKYASEFRDMDGKVESKVFYSTRNQEVIVEQPQNDTVTLLENGSVKAFFCSYAEFIQYFFVEAGLEEERVLIVQDQDGLRLAALQSNGKSIWKCVLFSDNELLNRHVGMGGKNGHRFYTIPEEYPVNGAKGEVLILTASDQLEGIEYFIQELPEVTFHIAANTQVSDKLSNLAKQQNVKVYPQISKKDLNALWDQCDFYLDINHYREIHNAIDTAHKKNLLIFGFENTAHCRELVNEALLFPQGEKETLVSVVKKLVGHPELVQEWLIKQQAKKREFWERLIFSQRKFPFMADNTEDNHCNSRQKFM